MTTSTQAITTSFTPPPAASIALTADSANAKMKIAAFLAAPASGAPVPSTVNILRRKGTDAFAALVANLTQPLPVTMATLTGFSAYRQQPAIPDVGTVHGWNLVKNGGFQNGSTSWTLHANASVVADSTSVSGYAARLVATAGFQNSTMNIPVEAGKTYSLALQVKSDGTTQPYAFITYLDGALAVLAGAPQPSTFDATSPTSWTEKNVINFVAPGNSRYAQVTLSQGNFTGTAWWTAIRVKQQATAPLAWTAADQQVLGNQGLSIQEATTNLTAADADMETAGVAAWAAQSATLTKDTTQKFAGAQSLKVVSTGAQGYAQQVGTLAAGQAVSVSVRHKQSVGTLGGIVLVSTPSAAVIGSDLSTDADWTVRKVSGVIAGGDTGWQVQLRGGNGVNDASWFDNLGVENKAYQTLNSGDGQEFTTTTRPASSVTETLPTGFDWTAGFAIVGTYRPDHAYTRAGDRQICELFLDANNEIRCYISSAAGNLRVYKTRAGVASFAEDGAVTAFAAGDTIAWGILFIPGTGLYLVLSKNGGAVATYSLTSAEAQLATFAAGTPTLYIGRYGGGAGYECDGTIGIIRVLKPNQPLAYIQAVVGMVS